MELRDLITARRLEKGWSQAELAARAGHGTKQQDVMRLESGATKSSKYTRPIVLALGISDKELGDFYDRKSAEMKTVQAREHGGYRPEPSLVGPTDLPVFAAVEGGPGEMVVNTDPIDIVARPWFLQRIPDAYGVVVIGESMVPVYEPGDIVLVNPRLGCVRGKDAIFISGEEDGQFTASLKRYQGSTETHWLAQQFNPPPGQQIKFERRVWTRAVRVVGKYSS